METEQLHRWSRGFAALCSHFVEEEPQIRSSARLLLLLDLASHLYPSRWPERSPCRGRVGDRVANRARAAAAREARRHRELVLRQGTAGGRVGRELIPWRGMAGGRAVPKSVPRLGTAGGRAATATGGWGAGAAFFLHAFQAAGGSPLLLATAAPPMGDCCS